MCIKLENVCVTVTLSLLAQGIIQLVISYMYIGTSALNMFILLVIPVLGACAVWLCLLRHPTRNPHSGARSSKRLM
jgi:hypothetical protein